MALQVALRSAASVKSGPVGVLRFDDHRRALGSFDDHDDVDPTAGSGKQPRQVGLLHSPLSAVGLARSVVVGDQPPERSSCMKPCGIRGRLRSLR
jgi:hypothetical protein